MYFQIVNAISILGGKIHYPWNLSISEAKSSNFSLDDDYLKPIIIAPEWARHFNKKTTVQSGGRGKQRGVDFYFKSDGRKK
jgi:hypothetical protein